MKKSKKLLIVTFVFLFAVIMSSCKEDSSLQTAKYKGSITVGYYSGSYLNEPVVNVIKAVANSMGLKVYLKSQTEETWQADLHNDDIDIMIDENNGVDALSDVLFTTKVIFAKQDGANIEHDGVIGVLDVGFIRESALAITDFHNAEYKYYAIPKMIMQDFESGYLDGIIVNEVDYLSYNAFENVEYNVINTRDIILVFEQGDATLLEEFNSILQQMQSEGMIYGLIYAE